VKKSSAPVVLKVENLSIRRDDNRILTRLDWEVREGEHWVILGPNGSGKTCLLGAITGYFPPSSGEMFLLGERYGETEWRNLRKRVAVVGSNVRQMFLDDEYGLDVVLSGREGQINYWGRRPKKLVSEARTILRKVECSHLAERPWEVLSQGERQRLLIGRALMTHAKIMILDEPCVGLDPVAREKFLVFLKQLGSDKNTPNLILVTHHVEEIIPIFTHGLLLRKGKVVAQGLLKEVLKDKHLSEMFDYPVKVKRGGSEYRLSM
jgi:iron complex transport system ATP-binding protein